MANRSVELAVAMSADASDVESAFSSAGDAARRFGDDVDTASKTADDAGSRLDSAAGAADGMASSSAQAAGGLGDLGGALSGLPGPLGALGAGMETAAPAIMGVTGAADLANLALEKSTLATKAATLATKALGLAQRALPILAIIGLIALLVAGIILLWKRSETFRKIVTGAFNAVKAAATFAWTWIRDHWKLMLAILTGPIGLAVRAIARHWDDIVDGARAAVGWIIDRWRDTKDRLVDFGARIKEKLVAAFNAVKTPIQWLVDKVDWLWDKLTNFPDLPSFDLPGFGRTSASSFGGRPTAVTTSGPMITNNINLYGVAASGDDVVRQLQTLFSRYGMQLGTVLP